MREKYSGDVETRFGPTLAAEHLPSEDGLTIDHETLRRWRSAASTQDFHRAVPTRRALDRVFQLEEPRTLSNDWVVRYRNRWFQLERQSACAPARSTVIVAEDATGAITIRYRDRVARWHEIPTPGPPTPAAPVVDPRPARASRLQPRYRPGPHHPWKQDAGAIFADVARSLRAER